MLSFFISQIFFRKAENSSKSYPGSMCWTGSQTSWRQLDKEHLQKLSRQELLKVRFTAISIRISQESVRNDKFLGAPRPTESQMLELWTQIHVLILKLWSPFNFENYCILLYLPSCFGWEDPDEFHMIIQGNQFKFIILNQTDSFVIVQRLWVLHLWTKITWHQYII